MVKWNTVCDYASTEPAVDFKDFQKKTQQKILTALQVPRAGRMAALERFRSELLTDSTFQEFHPAFAAASPSELEELACMMRVHLEDSIDD